MKTPLLGTPLLRVSLRFLRAIQHVLWVETFGPGVYGMYRVASPGAPLKEASLVPEAPYP